MLNRSYCRGLRVKHGVTIELTPCGTLPIPTFPNQGKEHSVGFLSTWEGGLQDTLPNSGRARVGDGQFFCHSGWIFGRAWFAFAHTSPPTGVTHWRELQGILNHAPLFRMTTKIKPLRDTPHPGLPQVGEGAFCHPELYKANHRNEVRTSEPVCRAVSGAHS